MYLTIVYVTLAMICDQLGLVTYGSFINPLLLIVLAMLIISFAYTKPELSFNLLKGNDISYGIYIYHMLWVNLALYLGFDNHVSFYSVILFTIVSGYISWRMVERPILSFKR